ncbi:MAG: hypothetical protein ACR2F6_16820 [Mycobacteriales bacterium]
MLNGVGVPYYGHTTCTGRGNCGGNPYPPGQVRGSGCSLIDQHALGSDGTI